MEAKSSFNEFDKLLHLAIENKVSESVHILIDHVEPDGAGFYFTEAWMFACESKDDELVRKLWKQSDQDPNFIVYAAADGYVHVLVVLIEAGLYPRCVSTMLRYVSTYGHLSIIDLLLFKYPDFDLTDAMQRALLHNKVEVCDRLFGRVMNYRVVLTAAAEYNREEYVRRIISFDENVDRRNAFLVAIRHHSLNILDILGDVEDDLYCDGLNTAAKFEHPDIVRYLLKRKKTTMNIDSLFRDVLTNIRSYYVHRNADSVRRFKIIAEFIKRGACADIDYNTLATSTCYSLYNRYGPKEKILAMCGTRLYLHVMHMTKVAESLKKNTILASDLIDVIFKSL